MSTPPLSALGSVGDAMSPGVISCAPETPLRTVARMMTTFRVHAVVVYAHADADDDGTAAPWGVVSDIDLVRSLSDDVDAQTAGLTAATPIVFVVPSDSVDYATQLMCEHATTHLVVVDPRSGHPIGVLSSLDVARTLAAQPARGEYGIDG